MGFLASAVLPADAYLVCSIQSYTNPFEQRRRGGEEKKKLTNPAPLRLPDSSSKRVLRLHPAPARLALCEPTLHSRNGASHRFERLVRSPGADRGRVDLQE